MLGSIEQLLDVINFEYKQSTDRIDTSLLAFRAYIILLYTIDFYNSSIFNKILDSTKELIHNAFKKSEINDCLVEFLKSTLTREIFQALVGKVQSFVTVSIMSGVFQSRTIESALRVLDLFNNANNAKDLKHRIDYKDFYNDAINKETSLKDHIILWIREKDRAKR